MSIRTHIVSGVNDKVDVMQASPILGEVISWSCGHALNGPKFTTTATALRNALRQAGLEEKLARDLAHRNALCRALHGLRKDGMVNRVSEDDDTFMFQVNETIKNSSGSFATLEFPFKAILSLNKKSGDILNLSGTQEGEQLRVAATVLLRQAAEERGASDVTRLIKRIVSARSRGRKFDPSRQRVDLVPIRRTGGMYFVFADQMPYVDQLAKFCELVGADLDRLPIANLPQATRSIAAALEEHLEKIVQDMDGAIDDFGDKTRESTIEANAKRVADLHFLLTSRQEYLAGKADDVRKHLSALEAKLVAAQTKLFGAGMEDEGDEAMCADSLPDSLDDAVQEPTTPVVLPEPETEAEILNDEVQDLVPASAFGDEELPPPSVPDRWLVAPKPESVANATVGIRDWPEEPTW